MFKNKKVNPWFTIAYALLQAIFVIGWGYWAIEALNRQNWLWCVASAICAIGCFSKSIRLLLQANDEATEYYRKANC